MLFLTSKKYLGGIKMTDAQKFEQECIEYCKKLFIFEIEPKFLKKAIQIPNDGIQVKYLYFEDIRYPIISGTKLDAWAKDNLGTYNYKNDCVVFVNTDGKTYITRGYKIIEKLKEAGFRQKDTFVPLSEGEKIIDFSLAKRWEKLK